MNVQISIFQEVLLTWAAKGLQWMCRAVSTMSALTMRDVLTKCADVRLDIKRAELTASVRLSQLSEIVSHNCQRLDVDECKNKNICGNNAKCANLNGGYQCDCKSGYEKIDQTSKSKCRDTNECLFGKFPCGANARCINTDGGYKCVCKDGFVGNASLGCKC